MQNEEVRNSVSKLLPAAEILLCDVEHAEQIAQLHDRLAAGGHKFHGLVHSIAFADYSTGPRPFEETPKTAFLWAVDVVLLADRAVPRLERPPGDGRVGRHPAHFHHANGQRELRLHGPHQGGPIFPWPCWPSRSAASRGYGSTRWPRGFEDLGLGGHSRLHRGRIFTPSRSFRARRRCGPKRPPTWPPSC